MWFALLAFAAQASIGDDVLSWRSARAADCAPDLPATVYEAAVGEPETGIQFVEGVRAGKGYGVAVLDAPIEAVWMAINDVDRHDDRFGSLSESRTLSGDPRASGRVVFQHMPLPIVSDRWWIVEQVHNADLYAASGGRAWEITATSVASEPPASVAELASGVRVAWSKTSWLLVDLGDGRTLAEYSAWSDPGGTLPVRPASRFAARAIGGFMEDIESYAQDLASAHRGGFVAPDQTPL